MNDTRPVSLKAQEHPCWNNLQTVIEEPYQPWNLKIENGHFGKCTFWEKVYYFIYSFFNQSHQDELVALLTRSLREITEIDPLSFAEAQNILISKIARMIERKDKSFWFFSDSGIPTNDQAPTRWTYFPVPFEQTPDRVQPYHDGTRYYSHPEDSYCKHFWTSQYLLFPGACDIPYEVNPTELVEKVEPVSESKDLKVHWIGHSTFLIQVSGMNILTDPCFGDIWPLFRRYNEPGIPLEKLPLIHTIVISHSHADHLDDTAMEFFKRFQPQLLVPQGLKAHFEAKGFENVIEHTWWQQTAVFASSHERVSGGAKITSLPANHWSQTSACDGNKTLWSGWMIESRGQKVYFAGDTAFNPALFAQIKEEFGRIDIALLPIAPSGEQPVHTDHKEALQAFNILDADTMIPMHWGTFRSGNEKLEDPIHLLEKELEAIPKLKEKVHCLKIGQDFSLIPKDAQEEFIFA